MIRVYIWLPLNDMFGHAAMHVNDTYISWWPEGTGRVHGKLPNVLRDHTKMGNIYAAAAIRGRGFEADLLAESRTPHTIEIDGLKEAPILEWWEGFGLVKNGVGLAGPMPAWKSFTQNCSTVVAKGLELGGGNTYAGAYNRYSVVWRPATVKVYAEAIRSGLRAKKAKEKAERMKELRR